VEAAIILMVFFLFLFGVIEVGRFLNVHQVVTDAAREGARFAVAPQPGTNSFPAVDDPDAVVGIVNRFLGSAGIRQSDVPSGSGASPTTVAITQFGPEAGDVTTYTRVRVETTYEALVPLLSMFEVPVVGEVRMRNETSN